MQAGFGEVTITPPLGIGMSGYFEQRLAEGVRDDLHSRALVVSQGDTHVALVVSDLLSLPMEDVEAVQQQVTARTGIPASHVVVSATHTHTGPVTYARSGFQRDEDYMRTWARLTAGAVEIAYRNRVEVTVGADKGRLPGVAFNRRFRMRNGLVYTNPGLRNPDIVDTAGPTDPEVTVLRFDGPDGVPVGILTHFACHPDTVGGNHFSADWVGIAARRLQDLLQPALIGAANRAGEIIPSERRLGVVVLNGPCGNINHINVYDAERRHRWPTVTQEIGIGLAAESARIAAGITTTASEDVGATQHKLTLYRMPMEEFLGQSQRVLDDPRTGSMERRRAQANIKGAEHFRAEPDTLSADLTCLRIGPALIATSPGELFCEFGLSFKEAFPNYFPMIANLANGYVGYIPTSSAYSEGGYEGRSTRLQPGSGEAIINTNVALAKQLLDEK